MRILKSFDTKIDAEELLGATQKYGEWNAILVKRHRIKLLRPLFLVFIALFVLNAMFYVLYVHLFTDHKILFRILAIYYAYTSISRCIYVIVWMVSSIISQIKSEKKYIDSTSNMEIKQRSFEKFLKRTLATFIVHILTFIFNAIVPFIIAKAEWPKQIAIAVWALILDLIFIIILNRVMHKIIEYEMNFDICTKDWVTSHKQEWFFKTKTMNISKDAIKVIQHSKEWIKSAIFQYWNLYIYTDSEVWEHWKKSLELSYIPDPKHLAKKLNLMLEKGEEKNEEWKIKN